jgi:AcrR family transcriptional regulator
VFSEQGLDGSLEEVARRAEVGIGTLYRHFPTRDALIEALVDDRVHDIARLATEALEAPDGWTGLRMFLEGVLEIQSADRNLNTVFAHYGSGNSRLQQMRKQASGVSLPLIERAQAEGSLRADFDLSDLTALFWAQGTLLDATRCVAPNWWRRQLALMLDAYRAENATPLPEPPLTPSQLRRARTALLDARRPRAGGSRTKRR